MKKKLTKTIVDNLKPNSKDVFVWCAELEGFGVRVQPSGRKTYLVRYRTRDASRTQRKLNIARCSDMPPEKARDLARKVFVQVAEGLDPAAERKPQKATQSRATLEAMFAGYIASMKAKSRASADEVERSLLYSKNNAADALGRHRHPSEITAMDIVDHLSTFFKAGHRGAADKHRSYICSAYTWAMKSANDYTAEHRQDWGVTRNPAADVAKDQNATSTRDRNLSVDELRQLWHAVDGNGFGPEIAACIRLLICCGQRVQETLRIDGCEIDFEKAVWNMPIHKTKCKKWPHSVPLPAPALTELAKLVDRRGDGRLFKSRTSSAVIDHRSVNQAIGRWLETVDMPHFTSRDLRRTVKSRMHDAGIDRFTRDLIQQHARGSDTGSKHYDRADYFEQMRQGMDKWSAWLVANVVTS